MRGDCTGRSGGHYESCFNSTCSRSPSPVKHKLWDPKHPPPGKIKDKNNKSESSLKVLGTSRPAPRNKEKNVSSSCFREEDCTQDSGPAYTTDSSFRDDANAVRSGSNNFLVRVQQDVLTSSPPSSRNRTPEPRRPHAYHLDRPAGNLTLQLELDASKNPPTVSISSQNSVISEAAPHVALSALPSAPSSTCTSRCHHRAPPSTTESTWQAFSAPESLYDPAKCPSYTGLLQAPPKSTNDRATSPSLGCGSREDAKSHSSPCQTICENCCPSHSKVVSSDRQDKGTSPIKTTPRPSTPIARVIFSPTPAHSRSNSAGTRGGIEVESNEGVFNVAWNGPVGPIKVKLPTSQYSTDDIRDAQTYCDPDDPELEVFYPSSCNQSQDKDSSRSPKSLASPVFERVHSRPAWNPCRKFPNCCPSGQHSSSSSAPWKSRSRCTTPSRTPRSRTPIRPDSNDRVHTERDNQPVSTIPWRNTSDDEPQNNCNTARQPGHHEEGCESHLRSPGSPRVIISPRAAANNELTIQWRPPSCDGPLYADATPCCRHGQEPEYCEHCRPRSPNVDVLGTEGDEEEEDEEYEEGEETEEDEEDEVCEAADIRASAEDAAEFQAELEEPSHRLERLAQDPCSSPSAGPRCTSCCPLQSDNPPPCCPSPCGGPPCACAAGNSCCPTQNWDSCCAPQGILECCCDDCAHCCPGICNCRKDSSAPVDGVNQCTSLPPHLQSDWSASLRGPPDQLKAKPVLYRDADGEHIMFADGSVEHLGYPCKPTPPAPPPQCSPAPPIPRLQSPPPAREGLRFAEECACYCDDDVEVSVDEDGRDGDGGHFDASRPQRPQVCTNFVPLREGPQENLKEDQEQRIGHMLPRIGDIVIRAAYRLPGLEPGKDDGKVAFYTSDLRDLRERDAIVRLGKFDAAGRWCSSRSVEMYVRVRHGRWMFLGQHTGHECLRPLEPDRHKNVRTPSENFEPRLGDLVVGTTPGPNSFYFWNSKPKDSDCHHSQLLLRAFIGRPRVVDANHNLACCVNDHLPVGYAELYMKVNKFWLFLGRDDHMFSEDDLLRYS